MNDDTSSDIKALMEDNNSLLRTTIQVIDATISQISTVHVVQALPDTPEIVERQRKYGFMDDSPRQQRQRRYAFMRSYTGNVIRLPFEHDPSIIRERERKYGFTSGNVPPEIIERWERQRKYGFTSFQEPTDQQPAPEQPSQVAPAAPVGQELIQYPYPGYVTPARYGFMSLKDFNMK